LKDARAQADKLRQNLSESERISGERANKVIALNSQLEELQSRLGESLRTAAERQSNLAAANGLISRQRSRLAEIGYIASEVQSTVNSMSLHLDSLRQRVIVDPTSLEGEVIPMPLPPAGANAPAQPPVTLPQPDLPEDLLKPNAPPRNLPANPPVAEPPSVAANPGVDPGDFSHKVSSLAENLSRLSGIINKRNLPPDPMPDPSPAPQNRTPGGVPDRLPPIQTEATTVNASYSPVVHPAELARLQGIKGVGVVYAMRLSQNGISSVTELANASADQLDAIIKAPRWRKPNYADWIAQAKHAMAGDGKLEVAAAPSASA
jgi:predicted flap endonuclease-1-like 5' DNA nuclease